MNNAESNILDTRYRSAEERESKSASIEALLPLIITMPYMCLRVYLRAAHTEPTIYKMYKLNTNRLSELNCWLFVDAAVAAAVTLAKIRINGCAYMSNKIASNCNLHSIKC